MIAYGFSMGGETVEDQTSGFAQRQSIAFYGVRMIVQFESEFLFDLRDNIWREWTQLIEFAFYAIYIFDRCYWPLGFFLYSPDAALTGRVSRRLFDQDRSLLERCLEC